VEGGAEEDLGDVLVRWIRKGEDWGTYGPHLIFIPMTGEC
jgi:hypothetical protein